MRGSIGISVGQGPPSYEAVKTFPKDDSKTCKAMAFSPEGRYFAWVNGITAKVLHCNTWKIVTEIKKPKISVIQFSSLGTYLMTLEPFIGILLDLTLSLLHSLRSFVIYAYFFIKASLYSKPIIYNSNNHLL